LKLIANNSLQIRFGNARVVEINFNGNNLGIASTKQTVVDYKFTPTKFEILVINEKGLNN